MKDNLKLTNLVGLFKNNPVSIGSGWEDSPTADGFYCGETDGTELRWYENRSIGIARLPVNAPFYGMWREVGFHVRDNKIDFSSIKPRRRFTSGAVIR